MSPRTLTRLASAGCLLIVCAGGLAAQPFGLAIQADYPVTARTPAQDMPARTVHSLLSSEQRADIFMARKEYADAVDYYLRALRESGTANPSAAPLWNKMGIAFQQEQRYGDARKAYGRALKDNKQFSEAWNNLGTTYFLANKFGKSVKDYRHALALEPNSPSYHLNLGTAYSRMKKYQEAIQEYRAALILDPNILRAQPPSAAAVIQAQSVDAEYFFCVAKVFASLGHTEEAVRYLRRAFEDGFKDDKKLDADPDFLKISKDPSYIALRTNPPVGIKD